MTKGVIYAFFDDTKDRQSNSGARVVLELEIKVREVFIKVDLDLAKTLASQCQLAKCLAKADIDP